MNPSGEGARSHCGCGASNQLSPRSGFVQPCAGSDALRAPHISTFAGRSAESVGLQEWGASTPPSTRNRMGGSHAQRDILSWTLTEAAIRLGDRALADATVAERLSWKPESPINLAWAARAGQLKRKQAV